MSTAVLLNFHEIRQIQRRTVPPSRFIYIGRKLHSSAKKIRQEWSNFSIEEREALQELAYDLIQPPSGVSALPFKLWAKANMLIIKIKGQEKEFFFCLSALDCLIDTILDAVERENSTYQQVLSDTLEELTSNSGSEKTLKAEETRGWLRSLSNKALREV
jgi:hypothetical protein